MDIVAKDAKKRVRIRGKAWDVPVVLAFSGIQFRHSFYFYNVVDFRPPKRGEYYLSGGPVEVWKAPNDLTTPFLVVQKTDKAKNFSGWTREEVEDE